MTEPEDGDDPAVVFVREHRGALAAHAEADKDASWLTSALLAHASETADESNRGDGS